MSMVVIADRYKPPPTKEAIHGVSAASLFHRGGGRAELQQRRAALGRVAAAIEPPDRQPGGRAWNAPARSQQAWREADQFRQGLLRRSLEGLGGGRADDRRDTACGARPVRLARSRVRRLGRLHVRAELAPAFPRALSGGRTVTAQSADDQPARCASRADHRSRLSHEAAPGQCIPQRTRAARPAGRRGAVRACSRENAEGRAEGAGAVSAGDVSRDRAGSASIPTSSGSARRRTSCRPLPRRWRRWNP